MPIHCEFCGKQAFYGNIELDSNNMLKYKRKYCQDHSNGAKYLNVKYCIVDTCEIIPTLGYISNKPISCKNHASSDMKNVTTRKCITCGIKQPSFNFINLKPKYCFDCKFENNGEQMINTKHYITNQKKNNDTTKI